MNDRTSRRRLGGTVAAVVVIAGVFAAGAAAGIAADRYYRTLRQPEPRGELELRAGPGGPRSADPAIRRAMATGIPIHIERLNLTPAQESALTAIAKRRRPRADSILRALRPVTRSLETEMMQEMLCALSPAQQTHWLAYMDTAQFDPEVVAERYRPIKTHTCATIPR